jgi:hypothetical protein
MANVRLTLVNRLKAGFFPVVKASAEFNLRHGAATEVSDTRARWGCTSGGRCSSGGGGYGLIVSNGSRSSTANDSALVINYLNSSEVCLDAEGSVERVSLTTLFRWLSISSVLGFLAGVLSGLVSLAGVCQGVADELGDDADSLCRAMVKWSCNLRQVLVRWTWWKEKHDAPLSTGWKLVSFRLSKPAPNSIWGTLQLPKLPIAEDAPVGAAAALDEASVAINVASGAEVTVTVT